MFNLYKPIKNNTMPVRENSPRRRGASTQEETGSKKGGWATLMQNRQEMDDSKVDSEDTPREFFITGDESAHVQILNDEPYAIEGHNIQLGAKKMFKFTPCQLNSQRHCLMCREGSKKTWKYVFKVLDFRGTWDKDKKKFKHDKPVEKLWYVGMKLAEQLKNRQDKTGKKLSTMVIDVSKSGKGTSTSYNLETAYDKDDNKVTPVKWETQYGSLEEIISPLTDAQLDKLGFSIPDDL